MRKNDIFALLDKKARPPFNGSHDGSKFRAASFPQATVVLKSNVGNICLGCIFWFGRMKNDPRNHYLFVVAIIFIGLAGEAATHRYRHHFRSRPRPLVEWLDISANFQISSFDAAIAAASRLMVSSSVDPKDGTMIILLRCFLRFDVFPSRALPLE